MRNLVGQIAKHKLDQPTDSVLRFHGFINDHSCCCMPSDGVDSTYVLFISWFLTVLLAHALHGVFQLLHLSTVPLLLKAPDVLEANVQWLRWLRRRPGPGELVHPTNSRIL